MQKKHFFYLGLAILMCSLSACGGNNNSSENDLQTSSFTLPRTLQASALPITCTLSGSVEVDGNEVSSLEIDEGTGQASATIEVRSGVRTITILFRCNDSRFGTFLVASAAHSGTIQGPNTAITFTEPDFNYDHDDDLNGVNNIDELINGTDPGMLSNNANLSSLTISSGTLVQPFQTELSQYDVSLNFLNTSLSVVPTPEDDTASISVNGAVVSNGVASQSITLSEGENTITIDVTAENGDVRMYEITVTRQSADQFTQQEYVKASNSETNDEFGIAVGLHGDTLVVGARFESSGSTGVNGPQTNNDQINSGAVYVSVRQDGIWNQQAYVKSSRINDKNLDHFGADVAIYNDTLAVGVPNEDSNATGINGDAQGTNSFFFNSGAVFVFKREGTSWSQQAYVKASNTQGGDRFSTSIALYEDTMVVGAFLEDSSSTGINGNQSDNSAENSGAVYVFTRSGDFWSQQAYIKASNAEMGDGFGISVALWGDTLAVGALGEDGNSAGINGAQNTNSNSDSGAVYIFTRSGDTWSQQAYIKASNPDSADEFGETVSLYKDTLVVGVKNESSSATGIDGDQLNNGATDSGATYVFVRNGESWTQQAYIKSASTGVGDNFGYSLDLFEDTLVVGARSEDSAATGINGNQADNSADNAGAVYIFRRSGNQWAQLAYIKASNTDPSDFFGQSVSIHEDTLAVGAIWEASNATGVNGDETDNTNGQSGAVYVYQ